VTDAKLHRYAGRLITVTWDETRCIHAAHCLKGLPAVFDRSRRPWVEPDGASATALMGVIERCPSGALKATLGTGGRSSERPQRTNTVGATLDGPLHLRGQLKVVTEDVPPVVIAEDLRLALCRCGASARKPFCDGSHAKVGFRDPGTVAPPQPKPGDAVEGGPTLTVVVKRAGPLKVTGDVQVLDAAGRPGWVGKSAALCRCGQSRSKPFCDGSHRAAGFDAA
jgi:CDGSH-type Zn-finger protein/uncharacterized Fe-S cluster protein YjdI